MAYSSDIRPLSSSQDSRPEKRALPAAPLPGEEKRASSSPLVVVGLIGACALAIAIFARDSRANSGGVGLEKVTRSKRPFWMSMSFIPPPIAPVRGDHAAGERPGLRGYAHLRADERLSGKLESGHRPACETRRRSSPKSRRPEVDQQLEQARGDLKNAQSNLEMSQLTSTRSEALFKKSTISSQERDQAVTDTAEQAGARGICRSQRSAPGTDEGL